VPRPSQAPGPRTAGCMEERPGSAVSAVARMETAALPLGISLTLDQVDATLVAIVLASVTSVPSAVAFSTSQERTTLYAQRAYVPKRP